MSSIAVVYPSIFHVVMWWSCGRIKAELNPESARAKHFPCTREHHSHDIAQPELKVSKCTVLNGRQTRPVRADGITTLGGHLPISLGTVHFYSYLLFKHGEIALAVDASESLSHDTSIHSILEPCHRNHRTQIATLFPMQITQHLHSARLEHD
jgi:hypothetical protein